ncbi:MAG: hypothetical protein AABZ60_09045 [Planctomycetota bacterium]
MVEEIYENKRELKKIESNLESCVEQLSLQYRKIEALERVSKNESDANKEHISEEQMELLKIRVKAKGSKMKVWAMFKKYFKVTRYRHLPKQKFREALDWLESYESE